MGRFLCGSIENVSLAWWVTLLSFFGLRKMKTGVFAKMVEFAIHTHQISMKTDKILCNAQSIPVLLKGQQEKPPPTGHHGRWGHKAWLW